MMYKKDLYISKYIIRLLIKQYSVDNIFECPKYFCLNESIALSGATNIVLSIGDIKQYVIIRK